MQLTIAGFFFTSLSERVFSMHVNTGGKLKKKVRRKIISIVTHTIEYGMVPRVLICIFNFNKS